MNELNQSSYDASYQLIKGDTFPFTYSCTSLRKLNLLRFSYQLDERFNDVLFLIKYNGRKKSEFVADFTFSRYKAKILHTGVIDPEKTPRGKIFWIRSLS